MKYHLFTSDDKYGWQLLSDEDTIIRGCRKKLFDTQSECLASLRDDREKNPDCTYVEAHIVIDPVLPPKKKSSKKKAKSSKSTKKTAPKKAATKSQKTDTPPGPKDSPNLGVTEVA